MILQALTAYYDRKLADPTSGLEPEGFKRVKIPFVLVLRKDGSLVGIDDTRTGEGRQRMAREFLVPKVFEGSRTSKVEANLLWDKASYIFGVSPKAKPDRLKKQKESFLSTIRAYFPDHETDAGVAAVVSFLINHQDSIRKHELWGEISTSDPNLAFRFEDDTDLISSHEAVREAIALHENRTTSERGVCLVTGQYGPLAKLENPIKGLRGSGKAESHLVSFNDRAYWSYGKSYGANASISRRASSAYVGAISHLRRNGSRQVLYVGDATTVFWAAKPNPMEDWFADFFDEPAKGESAQDNESIRALYKAPQTGAPPLEEDLTPFYVLGLAPNASRIAVRFWYAGTVGEVAQHIRQHFDDLEMVKSPKEWRTIKLKNLLRSTALQEKDKNIPPNLAGDTMKSILTGTPYPQTLLAAAIRRVRAKHEITYPRAALIKAVLVRDARFYRKQDKEVDVSLDISNANPGYLLGRLFAVLERVQEEAAKPNTLNSTIRDRFYGAASSTPVAVFPHLLKLKNYHIAKLEKYKGYYEATIGEIMDKLSADNAFPPHLSLPDQGRFAVGYYHQRQTFFTKKEGKDI